MWFPLYLSVIQAKQFVNRILYPASICGFNTALVNYFSEGKNDLDIHLESLTAWQSLGVSASHSESFKKADNVWLLRSVFLQLDYQKRLFFKEELETPELCRAVKDSR